MIKTAITGVCLTYQIMVLLLVVRAYIIAKSQNDKIVKRATILMAVSCVIGIVYTALYIFG